MAETTIEWCDYTFNPVEGCQRVSPGCVNCYAERKNKWLRHGQNWGPGSPRITRSDAYWRKPWKWDSAARDEKVRRKVFVASVADVFEDHPEWVEPRERLFSLISDTPNLDWLLLTKRPQNILRLWPGTDPSRPSYGEPGPENWPNVWLGTTVEDQQRADERIPYLLNVAASVRFLSCEPLLEAVDLRRWLKHRLASPAINPPPQLSGPRYDYAIVDWVICGGESGPGARQFNVGWARSIHDQCAAANVAFFMKQLGARTLMSHDGGDPLPMFFKKHQSVDLAFIPEDLRIRQFPQSNPNRSTP